MRCWTRHQICGSVRKKTPTQSSLTKKGEKKHGIVIRDCDYIIFFDALFEYDSAEARHKKYIFISYRVYCALCAALLDPAGNGPGVLFIPYAIINGSHYIRLNNNQKTCTAYIDGVWPGHQPWRTLVRTEVVRNMCKHALSILFIFIFITGTSIEYKNYIYSIYLSRRRKVAYVKMDGAFIERYLWKLKSDWNILHEMCSSEVSPWRWCKEHFNRTSISRDIVDWKYPSFFHRLLCIWATDIDFVREPSSSPHQSLPRL